MREEVANTLILDGELRVHDQMDHAGAIYELLNGDLALKRSVTVEDFHLDWQKH